MRTLSYRTKQRMRKGTRLLLLGLVVLLAILILTVVYMGRFVVYGPDGAYLDFNRSTYRDAELPTTSTQPATGLPDVRIDYADANANTDTTETVSGYYIDLEMLQNPGAVLEAVKALEMPCTVLLDLKGGNGSFYYSTDLDGVNLAAIDISAVDETISYLKSRGFTMIARVKTLQDTAFAEKHLTSALVSTQDALWVGNGFYWLDPSDSTVASYLKQIARDLAGKGFKEIVFDDFRFPSGSQIVYSSEKSRSKLMKDLAKELLSFFSNSSITISFGNPSSDFAPELPSRVYITDVIGSNVKSTVESFHALADPEKQLVFLTGSKDNRFDAYQVLRPLIRKTVS